MRLSPARALPRKQPALNARRHARTGEVELHLGCLHSRERRPAGLVRDVIERNACPLCEQVTREMLAVSALRRAVAQQVNATRPSRPKSA